MPLYVIILIVAVVLIIGWQLHQRDRRRVHECLRKQAARLNGKVRPATLFTYPQLYFRYQDVEVLVSAMPGSSGHGRARPPTAFAQFYFEIYPEYVFRIRNKSVQTMIEKMLGLRDLQTGNSRFDDQFVVQSNNEDFIRHLLTSEIQNKLLEFNPAHGLDISFQKTTLYRDGRLVLGVERPRLDVTIEKIATDDQDYYRLIDTATMLYDRLWTFAEITEGT